MTRHEPDQESQSRTPVSAPSREGTRPRKNQSLPPEVMEILLPSLKVGGIAGVCGLFTGAAAGIIRSAPPVLFSAISGVQWFALSSSYYATRLVALKRFEQGGETTPTDRLKASTIAGGVAGTVGGVMRGPRNILPGAIVISLFGAGGQALVNWRAERAARNPPKSSDVGFWERWSPLTQLSDQDYEKILEERLLRAEADIAIVDDHIKELLEADKQSKKGSQTNEGAPQIESNISTK